MTHWTVPYVTGKKYYLRWAGGLDFEKMKIEIIPWLWDDDDGDVWFEMPHYDVREAVHVDTNLGDRIENSTLVYNWDNWSFGDNVIYNDTDTRRINVMVNGLNKDLNRITMTGVRCLAGCPIDNVDDLPLEDRIRYWSVLADWDTRTELPVDGEEIVIPSNW